MTLDEFVATLSSPAPPAGAAPLLQALWWDRKGAWPTAHDVVSQTDSRAAAKIHAYLHRKEGDLGNAAYWYRQAGESPAADALDQEWRRLAVEALSSDRT